MIIIYGIHNCDSCKKAISYFCDRAEFYDIRKTPPSREILERFLARFGNQLINIRSKTWRSLDMSEKQMEAIKLIEKFPTLMKRPIIECTDTAKSTIGWSDKIKSEYN